MSKTLWFSYSMPAGETLDNPAPLRSPFTWTWTVGNFLRAKAAELGYAFQYVNLDDATPRTFGADDVVIGHLWFESNTFMQQALESRARLKCVLQPYTHKMVGDEMLDTLKRYFGLADHLFLITGPYWWDTMGETEFAAWQTKATRLDNIVHVERHPFKRRKWNPVGKRRAMAVGYDNPIKGMDIVADLARLTGMHIGVYGAVNPATFTHAPTVTCHGGLPFDADFIARAVDEYDFFISTGRFDANPTTLNETACWGLIGACTPQSGYWPDAPFYELRTDDMMFNLDQIDRLQHLPDHILWGKAHLLRVLMERDHAPETACAKIWDQVTEMLS